MERLDKSSFSPVFKPRHINSIFTVFSVEELPCFLFTLWNQYIARHLFVVLLYTSPWYTYLFDIVSQSCHLKILKGYWVNFPFKIASMWQFSCQISSIIWFILKGGYLWYKINVKAVGHTAKLEPPWPRSYRRSIYIYLFNQYLSHLRRGSRISS